MEVENKDNTKVEVTSDEVGDAKDEAKEEEVDNKEVPDMPEEKPAVAEGDSKVTSSSSNIYFTFLMPLLHNFNAISPKVI